MRHNLETWDSAAPVAPRSRLYALEPIGRGTPLVESLSSYIIRLAEAHAVSVVDLVQGELSPFLESSLYIPTRVTYVINGVGETARRWVRAVETVTLRSDLRGFTLFSLAPAVPDTFLFRTTRAWCPECYDEVSAGRQPVYEPLLWCLNLVEICLRHNRPLSTACPHCKKPLRPMTSASRAGFCSRCRLWLGAASTRSSSRAWDHPPEDQLWLVAAVGELLAHASETEQLLLQDHVRKVLSEYTQAVAEGNIAAIAEIAGHERSVLTCWLKGRQSARLDTLLRPWYRLGLPTAALVGDASPAAITQHAQRSVEIRQRRQVSPRRTRQQISAALQRALEEAPAPSLTEIARKLGYSTAGSLRRANGPLCARIAANYRRSGRSHWWRRAGAKAICEAGRIKRILEDHLAGKEPVPPLDHIAAGLGFARGESLRQKFPDLCREIGKRIAQQKTEHLAEIEPALKQAARESPPPSLRNVARRVGFSEAHLWRRAPLLCQELLAYRQTYAIQRHSDLENKLKAVLTEEPPPSLADLYKRLGTSPWIVWTSHPVLRLAIADRHRQYRKQETQANRDAVRKEVGQVVGRLYEQGLCPSVGRVKSLLTGGFIANWIAMHDAVSDARKDYERNHGPRT